MLDVRAYPAWTDRGQREQAINAVQAFRDEVEDVFARLRQSSELPDEDCDVSGIECPLHQHIYISQSAAVKVAPAIAQSAQRHGLVYYDPQSDTLIPPAPLSRGETRQPVGSSEHVTIPNEEAIMIAFGPWIVRAYPETTRRRYQLVKESGSDACGCAECKNFVLGRNRAYPLEVLAVLDSLGADYRKESEVHHYGRTPAGLHTYRGWFYMAGSIESGPECWHKLPDGKLERRFHRIGPDFEAGLGKKSEYGYSKWETVLISAGFADSPCVEMDFYTDLPWLSDAPEPE
jgi:hypothetical protein